MPVSPHTSADFPLTLTLTLSLTYNPNPNPLTLTLTLEPHILSGKGIREDFYIVDNNMQLAADSLNFDNDFEKNEKSTQWYVRSA